jgi:signal transduction histidine kinase
VQLETRLGSGFGLAIAKEFMTNQGGRIGIEETVGDGATFKLWFPTLEVGA